MGRGSEGNEGMEGIWGGGERGEGSGREKRRNGVARASCLHQKACMCEMAKEMVLRNCAQHYCVYEGERPTLVPGLHVLGPAEPRAVNCAAMLQNIGP